MLSSGNKRRQVVPNRALNVLVLSDFKGIDANVVRDYLYCFNQHSSHRFFYLHSWHSNNCQRLRRFDFNRFDAIVLFWDFFWVGCVDPSSYCYVPKWVVDRVAESRALKIQFLQDEYRDVLSANKAMSRFGINVMFSCVAKKNHALFYPKERIPSLAATYPVLTGYVPAYLETINHSADIDRAIDIGYRSRKLPYYLGQLGQEKSIIAERFQEIADLYGFAANISVKESDRIYGAEWLDFMKSCRFSLGTESGASVVDFDGDIRKKCQRFLYDHPKATFEETKSKFFDKVDGNIVVQTISPRIFEASAFENTLILHEGLYEGMLEPDVHYICVKKDYSNILEVVERMRDMKYCKDIARNAKRVLIESKDYNYSSFVKNFDAILERHVPTAKGLGKTSRTIFYLLNYLNNDRLLPRAGAFLSIPHTCDLVYHFTRFGPYAVTVFYSAILVLSLICQAPQLCLGFCRKLLSASKVPKMAPFSALKDLRVAALLFQKRSAIQASRHQHDEIQFCYCRDTGQLIATSVPFVLGIQEDAKAKTLRLAYEHEIITNLFARNATFSLAWENRLLGNGLLLGANSWGRYCIFLNDDCVYRFDNLNRVFAELNEEERALLKRLLLGGWKDPSWLDMFVGAAIFAWAFSICVLYKIWLVYLRYCAGFLKSACHECEARLPGQKASER
jgi:hypothetical protein